MGRKCAVNDCINNNSKHISKSFYGFPRDSETCLAWVKFCGTKELELVFFSQGPEGLQKLKMCSDHFGPESFRNFHLKDKGLVNGAKPVFPAHRFKETVGEYVIYHLD
ncbi:uncharacterized protein LOC109415311 [Aedes albopictus]|uniref:Putative cpij018896 serine threonine-protein kinase n=1 Tax=Aedes albopictus TaxID=7160 RepID=A0A023ED00_AEDAL|nr:uncharacterized protein LOC109415311 [Aedes albopictus]KXJ62438.1 hypothetical protein RP20_CCG009815 [Aedes albopictus]KXJ70575.1 hypothetical protein RP20_CCG023115 [Aedes albopictus]